MSFLRSEAILFRVARDGALLSASRREMNSEEKPRARAKAAWERPSSVRAFLSFEPRTPCIPDKRPCRGLYNNKLGKCQQKFTRRTGGQILTINKSGASAGRRPRFSVNAPPSREKPVSVRYTFFGFIIRFLGAKANFSVARKKNASSRNCLSW